MYFTRIPLPENRKSSSSPRRRTACNVARQRLSEDFLSWEEQTKLWTVTTPGPASFICMCAIRRLAWIEELRRVNRVMERQRKAVPR